MLRHPSSYQYLPTRGNRFSRWVGRVGLKILGGWKIVGEMPDLPKAIIPVAPHTSNWDFFVGLCVKLALGLRLNFLGKHSIFVFPVKGLLTWLGGIPVQRSSAQGIVGQIVEQFREREQLVVVIAPEGTRSKVSEWKKGFLHMASQAHVPVVPVAFCFATRSILISAPMEVGEDTEEALARIKNFTNQATGKNPELQ
ncbi:acyltransferase [Aliidiomarina iranensis]|uniref:Acyltransferase n=1 Tax=Aliidiomarina iranensis TaxID=1434071 RepID=A0A432VVG0_9GAMM|nr:1-acyl-sn-glycerol-3-phosphate acyltransferase [Aliidiomarina iranensis]RUO20441.1 acyltransferase [Aliidiomarina iranensis]